MNWLFRPMTTADLPEVMAIEERCFVHAWDEACFLGELVAPLSSCLVCCHQSVVVGYMVYRVVVDECHLLSVAVDPGFQRKGMAKRLVKALFDDASRRGARLVWLEVRPSNAAARRLYEHMGFEQVERRLRYYENDGEDALVMARALEGRLADLFEEEG